MKKTLVMFASAAFFFAACNNSQENQPTQEPAATETTETPATTEAPAGDVATITINGNDAMQFDIHEIKVKEGQTVKLTLHHIGKAPKVAMGHNFVLLAAGVDMAEFAKAAIDAKDNDYIPKNLGKDIIAHTKLIGGGESTEIEFKAPAKGTYDYLCSFPGHSGLMKGKFIVE
ncbi:MAG: azurin [Chitinophagaceae bacterium]|nr:azurin [Chitinophagaceae bacterium]MCW5905404.1 azurin [Chitinophagaceae bacterium]